MRLVSMGDADMEVWGSQHQTLVESLFQHINALCITHCLLHHFPQPQLFCSCTIVASVLPTFGAHAGRRPLSLHLLSYSTTRLPTWPMFDA